MQTAVVFSSRTGNTRLLAETIRTHLSDCLYFGPPDEKALEAQRIFVGFWTDKGTCDHETEVFLKTLTDQQVFLFGTAGFGGSPEYYDKILTATRVHLKKGTRLLGTFMCQGKMPMSVRQRYEKMLSSPIPSPKIQGLLENFDRALSHPDAADLKALDSAVSGL